MQVKSACHGKTKEQPIDNKNQDKKSSTENIFICRDAHCRYLFWGCLFSLII